MTESRSNRDEVNRRDSESVPSILPIALSQQGTGGAMLHVGLCIESSVGFRCSYIHGCCVYTTFSTSRVAFIVHCFMAIVEAVEALHDLILWGESFCCIVQPVYKETIHNAAICCTWIFHVDYDRVVEFDGFSYFTSISLFPS